MTRPLLTTRQLDVLQSAARGRTYRETAEELGISPQTAKIHRKRIMRRLREDNMLSAVLVALRLGVLAMPYIETLDENDPCDAWERFILHM